jgi:hypothetical protein
MDVHDPKIVAALALSVLAHGVLLGLPPASPAPTPQARSPTFLVRLLPVKPLAAPPPRMRSKPVPALPQTPVPRVGAASQTPARVIAPQPSNTMAPDHADAPEATPSQELVERPLDLSPRAISQASRHGTVSGSRPHVMDQILETAPKPASALAQGISAGALPDCLHVAKDTQGNLQVLPGGLLAVPYLAYSAMAGKCK